MEPFSARISHHGLLPPRAIAFSGGSWNLSRPAISPRSAAISFTRGSWNLSRPADFTTVCCHHAPSHSLEVIKPCSVRIYSYTAVVSRRKIVFFQGRDMVASQQRGAPDVCRALDAHLDDIDCRTPANLSLSAPDEGGRLRQYQRQTAPCEL